MYARVQPAAHSKFQNHQNKTDKSEIRFKKKLVKTERMIRKSHKKSQFRLMTEVSNKTFQ